MKSYDPNIDRGIHTVKITLQIREYKGHIVQKISGNCKGGNILYFNFEDGDDFPDNDCQMKYNEDYDYFTCVLKNESGDTLRCDGDAEEMNNMIVGVEIIDFRKE